MRTEDLKPNKILRGPLFPEPNQVITAMSVGSTIKLIGKGQNTKTVYQPILTPTQLALVEPNDQRFAVLHSVQSYNGTGLRQGLA